MRLKVVRGDGRPAGPGRVAVGDEVYEADAILISTGSDPVIPPIEGLPEAGYWTNREATALSEILASTVVLGGGPVGIELSQFLRCIGSEVILVHGADLLVERVDECVACLVVYIFMAVRMRLRSGCE